ncbi:MAG TPA: hypothetical protein VEG35_04320, partial [Burkholderiales bacterium]|nr:hypothetical protein [Burkholderiales bacterium]
MKRATILLAAAAALLAAAGPAFPQGQVAFKLLAGPARIQGDDYNRGILGAYRFAQDTSDTLSGGYQALKGGLDFQAEIVNYWSAHFGTGIGVGYYRMSNKSGLTGSASVPDPTYEFTSTYTPKVSVITLFLNLHYRVRLVPRVELDVFAGPVFQVVQFSFTREATSGVGILSELETFNASNTALGLQGGLGASCRIVRGVAIVAEGFYRSSTVTNLKGNWFLTQTTGSGTVTSSNSSYYYWYY